AGGIAHSVHRHTGARRCCVHHTSGTAAEKAGHFLSECAAAPGVYDVIGHGRNGEVSHDADDHKDEVGHVRPAEKGVAVFLHLGNVEFEHFLLYLADDAAEDVGHGQP